MPTTDRPRVTIVIPTFNRAALVVEAVESVLRQSYRDFEVVVCDDGSTDGTAARVGAFEAPVRYVPLDHTGRPGAARNRGIEEARGDLVAFLDDDDLWEPGKLALQVDLLDREAADLVYSDRRVEFDDDAPAEIIRSPAPQGTEQWLDLVIQGHFPSVCTVLVRSTVLRQARGFDETLVTGEDLDLWLRLGATVKVARVPEPLVRVRRRSGTLSDRTGAQTYLNAIEVLRRSLTGDGLFGRQRRLCHATLATLNVRLAALQGEAGEKGRAACSALRALRHAPASLSAWTALATALRGRRRPDASVMTPLSAGERRGS